MIWIAIAGGLIFFAGVIASVALHEVGHMVPAKLFNVRVTQFMIGVGKTIWSRRRGETEYGIKMLPFAGYVRMVGMYPPAKDGRLRRSSTGPFQQLVEEAREASNEDVPPGEEHRLFYRKKPWQKIIVMLGGPTMNIVLSIILFSVVLMGFGQYVLKPVVSSVSDCVIAASEQRTECRADDPVAPAKEAGFKPGDEIVAFNGQPVDGWEDLQARIRDAGAGASTMDVIRDGERITLEPELLAAERPDLDDPSKTEEVGFLGVAPLQERERQGPVAVASYMGELTSLTGQAMLRIPERMVGVVQAAFGAERAQDSPMSIVGASRVAGEIATLDAPVGDRIATFIQWLAAVNLFIALFNLIPLLPLDGGHVLGALWEWLRRGIARLFGRPDPGYVDVARAMPIAYAAASVIIVMGVILLYADIVNPVRLMN